MQYYNNQNKKKMEEDDTFYYTQDTDLDISFTSTTSDRTMGTSSARSSLARSSLTLSFNDRISSVGTPSAYRNHHDSSHQSRPHRRWDPHWSAIRAARNVSHDGRLHLRHLKLLSHLGSGDLGRVFLCRIRDFDDDSQFALKVVDKDTLSNKKLGHLQTETEILSMLDHPFLPTLYAHIEVSHYTCMMIDYCSQGDLHSLLRKQPNYRLPIRAVKFYVAEVLVALEYLHSLGIVYRDLKPENILLREDGHIMLSDFDLCFRSDVTPRIEKGGFDGKANQRRRRRESEVGELVAEPTGAFSKSCVGTHEYLAPELVSGNGHGNGVDWWAFGVLVYELMYGVTPFKGANKEATLRNIASSKDARFCNVAGEEGDKETEAAKDLIQKLLVKDPQRRMGSTLGAAEIKRHSFFDGIKWALIRGYRPPEVRGGVLKKTSKSHVMTGVRVPKRRKWLWKRLSCFTTTKKGSKISHCYSNTSTSTTFSSVHNKIRYSLEKHTEYIF